MYTEKLASPGGPVGGKVVLLSTYELGRQPFGLASPAAWLRTAGATVTLQDLAVTRFEPESVRDADLVGVHVPMHTATRLAEPLLARVRQVNPRAHLCVFGLYAPMNEAHLRSLGADTILGAEFETGLVEVYRRLTGQDERTDVAPATRRPFLTPDRTGLPSLDQYARLALPSGGTRVVGYTEATRGCKHLCRHCPIVPVYNGRFTVVPEQVVFDDVRLQVDAGAQHITFGDPDFFNGPAHATRIVRRLHDAFPALSYDVTIKVEHLARHARLLPVLRETGCVLITTAVESFDDAVLDKLDKRHTRSEFEHVVELTRALDLAFNPTFVAFTPWTTVDGYRRFLAELARLELVDNVSPVQYAIRLLLPAGSKLLELPEVAALAGAFDDGALCYPWRHPDPAVDRLQRDVQELVTSGQRAGRCRRELFRVVGDAADAAGGDPLTAVGASRYQPRHPVTIPYLTEPWYC